MTIDDIKRSIDRIENALFGHSLSPVPLSQLREMRKEVRKLREAFLRCSFVGHSAEELDDIRFRLLECDLNLAIAAREAMKEDSSHERQTLEELYQTTM